MINIYKPIKVYYTGNLWYFYSVINQHDCNDFLYQSNTFSYTCKYMYMNSMVEFKLDMLLFTNLTYFYIPGTYTHSNI